MVRLAVAVVAASLGGAAVAEESASCTNGTFVGTGGADKPNTYLDASQWTDGAIANGPGAVAGFSSLAYVRLPPTYNQNSPAEQMDIITLGHLVALNRTGSEGSSIRLMDSYDKWKGTRNWDGYENHRRTPHIVLDSGVAGQPATLTIASTNALERSFINPNFLLKSDLAVAIDVPTATTLRNVDNQYGDAPLLGLHGDMIEDGRKRALSITSTKPGYYIGVWGNNRLTGDVTISNAFVLVERTDAGCGYAQALGVSNTVKVLTGAKLDIGGFDMPESQTLELTGTLRSRNYTPAVTGSWNGPVVLMDGGSFDGPGADLKVNGVISGEADLVKTGPNVLELTAANTYTGDTYIKNGYIRAMSDEAFGTGKKIVFNGGGLELDGSWDPTASGALKFSNTARFRVEEGKHAVLSKTANWTPCIVHKSGLGNLSLGGAFINGNSELHSGSLTFDHSINDTTASMCNAAWWFYLDGGGTELILKGGTKAYSDACLGLQVRNNSAARVTMSGVEGSKFQVETDRGYLDGNVQTGCTLDLAAEEGTYCYSACHDKPIADGLHTITLRVTVQRGQAFAGFEPDTTTGAIVPSPDMQTDWSTEEARLMDVTAENAATMPAGAKVRALRFNDPNVNALALAEAVTLVNGAILMTPESGTSGEIVLSGGSLTSGNGEITIHQWNTNRVLRITTPLVGAVRFTKSGPGEVILDPGTAENTFSGQLNVIGGTLEVVGQNAMKSTAKRFLKIGGGATLRVRGAVSHGWVNGQNSCFSFDEAGGTIETPTADDSFTLTGWLNCSDGGRLFKKGKGTLNWWPGSGWMRCQQAPHFHGSDLTTYHNRRDFYILDGVFDVTDCGPTGLHGNERSVVHVDNGATVRGSAITVQRGELYPGIHSLEVMSGGAKIDVCNASNNKLDLCNYMGYPSTCPWRARDYIYGEGDLTFVNSGTGSKTVAAEGGSFSKFFGAFAYVPGSTFFSAVRFALPNGILDIPEGRTNTIGQMNYVLQPAPAPSPRLGRVRGGSLAFSGPWEDAAEIKEVFIGRDADETFSFGTITFKPYVNGAQTQNDPQHAPPTGVTKIGSDTWRITESNNYIRGAFTVRKGTVLVAADSPGLVAGKDVYGFAKYNGALGNNNVYVGDGTRDSITRQRRLPGEGDGEAKLLTDAAVTVGNDIYFGDTDYPVTVGGGSASPSEFKGKLFVTRAVNLHAEAGDVTFSGKVSGTGAVTKTGPGKVILSNAANDPVNVASVLGGELELAGDAGIAGTYVVTDETLALGGLATVKGDLAIAEGAVLDVSGVDFDALTADKFVLVAFDGACEGRFASVVGLPDGWSVRYLSHTIRLSRNRGLFLQLR